MHLSNIPNARRRYRVSFHDQARQYAERGGVRDRPRRTSSDPVGIEGKSRPALLDINTAGRGGGGPARRNEVVNATTGHRVSLRGTPSSTSSTRSTKLLRRTVYGVFATSGQKADKDTTSKFASKSWAPTSSPHMTHNSPPSP